MKVLLVKTSSLGDLLHVLPAISDAAEFVPGLNLDWVIEDGFAEIGSWHPKVGRVIPVAMRQWRRDLSRGRIAEVRRAVAAFRKDLRATPYDIVIDAQGLYKSAAIALAAQGERCGFSRRSAREPLAALAYRRTADIPRAINIIERNRRLFAELLGYPLPVTAPDFGLGKERFALPAGIAQPYVVLIHSASWQTKLWPLAHWRALAALAGAEGRGVVLPWHDERERIRAEAIADGLEHAIPMAIDLAGAGRLIAHAEAVASVETGFAHLSAALGRPTAVLYGPTGTTRHGVTGERAAELSAGLSCSPCYGRRCAILQPGAVDPPCLAAIAPGEVAGVLADLVRSGPASPADTARQTGERTVGG